MPVKPALVLPPEETERWDLAKQIGVEYATTRLPDVGYWRGTDTEEDVSDVKPWDYEPILHLQQEFENAGLELRVIEDIYPPLDKVRLGTDREAGVKEMCTLIENMGAVGIPVLCYAWSAVFNWFRTSTTVRTRGGALTSQYDHELSKKAPKAGDVTEEELWDNLEYFLEQVVPVAEDAGVKLALHPDDPPLSPVRGISRLITSPEAFERVMELYPSDHNGIAFCQGNFTAMGADIPSNIRRFADDINYVHFRDVEGTNEKFTEVWHDDGPTDMLEAMRTYEEVGFDGPMRPDHVPTMAGETNDNPGYEMKGRLFAIGYMKGLLESAQRET